MACLVKQCVKNDAKKSVDNFSLMHHFSRIKVFFAVNESKMMRKIDFSSASSDSIIDALCKQLDEIRLSRNISQADLAAEAGISRSTMTRLADGQPISLDSFVRVMVALHLTDHLATLLPDPTIRPIERVQLEGAERQRASAKKDELPEWRWRDSQT